MLADRILENSDMSRRDRFSYWCIDDDLNINVHKTEEIVLGPRSVGDM